MGNQPARVSAYRFEVILNNNKIGFRSILGLKLTASFEPLSVGGLNQGPVMLPVPVKEPGRLTMEKGAASLNQLKDFIIGKRLAQEMQVKIMNEDGGTGITYAVALPILESVELSKLDAMESSILIETFTVLHRGITRL